MNSHEYRNKTEKEFESCVKFSYKIKVPLYIIINFIRKKMRKENSTKDQRPKNPPGTGGDDE
jgi:hypothetical protein